MEVKECLAPKMQAYLVGPSSNDRVGLFDGSRKGGILANQWPRFSGWNRRASNRPAPIAAAAINGEQDHYAVLGLSSSASSAEIKKAYRLLARKYHPDVSKDLQAGQVFKSIRLAYEVLSNETTRAQYDGAIRLQESTGRSWRKNWTDNYEFDEGMRIYRWAELRQRMKYYKQRQQYDHVEEDYSSYGGDDMHDEPFSNERGPFSEVLKSAFLTIFFMQTFGCQVSLTLHSLIALFDKQLDAGYKLGHLIAWVLGGQGGVLLTLCLSFASWLCGKTSSSLVALVVVAMWVGANVARFIPLPPGAILTLLYMSIKLQDGLW